MNDYRPDLRIVSVLNSLLIWISYCGYVVECPCSQEIHTEGFGGKGHNAYNLLSDDSGKTNSINLCACVQRSVGKEEGGTEGKIRQLCQMLANANNW